MRKKPYKEHLPDVVDRKYRKRQQAQQDKQRPIFFGLGLFGVIGWTVAVPAVLGVFIGRWLDSKQFGRESVSWTVTCFLIGLCLGIVTAWRWMKKEGEKRENHAER